LIQDFEFPEASSRLRSTPDGQFLIATGAFLSPRDADSRVGVYKPQVRVFELAQMAMKFDRHTDCETVQMEVCFYSESDAFNDQILSDDWKKFVLLQADRSIEFHSQHGIHFRTRIPKVLRVRLRF
jgi:ribosome biogenesis protein ENP2